MEQGTAQLATLVAERRAKYAAAQEAAEAERQARREELRRQWPIRLAEWWQAWGLREMFGPATVDESNRESVRLLSAAAVIDGIPVQGILQAQEWGTSTWVACWAETPLASPKESAWNSYMSIDSDGRISDLTQLRSQLLVQVEDVIAKHQKMVEQKRKRGLLRLRAQQYLLLERDHDAACREWAEKWSAQLYHPLELSEIRYVPIGRVQPGANDDVGELLGKLIVLEDAAAIARLSPGVIVSSVGEDGVVTKRIVGAFLDGRTVATAVQPDITKRPKYRPHWKAGRFYAWGTPGSDAEPQEDPPKLLWFADWLRQCGEERLADEEYCSDESVAAVAAWTDDEL